MTWSKWSGRQSLREYEVSQSRWVEGQRVDDPQVCSGGVARSDPGGADEPRRVRRVQMPNGPHCCNGSLALCAAETFFNLKRRSELQKKTPAVAF